VEGTDESPVTRRNAASKSHMLRWQVRSAVFSRPSILCLARSLVAFRGFASMSASSSNGSIPQAPVFKPFNLTLIQLGQIGADKAANLKHARDMIRKAANGEVVGGTYRKPDLIVLPVSLTPSTSTRCNPTLRKKNGSTED
jgi:hypothetical protein